MKNQSSIVTMLHRLIAFTLFAGIASGCSKDKEPSNPPESKPKDDFQEAGESFEEGFKKTGQGIKKGVEKLGDEIEEATDKAAPDDDSEPADDDTATPR